MRSASRARSRSRMPVIGQRRLAGGVGDRQPERAGDRRRPPRPPVATASSGDEPHTVGERRRCGRRRTPQPGASCRTRRRRRASPAGARRAASAIPARSAPRPTKLVSGGRRLVGGRGADRRPAGPRRVTDWRVERWVVGRGSRLRAGAARRPAPGRARRRAPAGRRAQRAQRVGLTARPVQREHQLTAQSLAERRGGDRRVEVGDQLGVAAQSPAARRSGPRGPPPASPPTGSPPPPLSARRRTRARPVRATGRGRRRSTRRRPRSGPRRAPPDPRDESFEPVGVDVVGRRCPAT